MRITHGVERRAVLGALTAISLGSIVTPLPSSAISATTMTGKTKADLGIFLVDEIKTAAGTLSADVVLSGGVIATASFDTPWKLAEGGYYDVEAQSKEGEVAFLQVKALGKGEALSKLPKTWFGDVLFTVDGRYGAYGAPTDIKLKELSGENDGRSLELSFTTLTPGMTEVPRKGIVRAIQAPGSNDVLMLVATASPSRWKKAGDEAAATVKSFRVAATRPTSLMPEPSADFRYGKTSGPSSMKSRNDGF